MSSGLPLSVLTCTNSLGFGGCDRSRITISYLSTLTIWVPGTFLAAWVRVRTPTFSLAERAFAVSQYVIPMPVPVLRSASSTAPKKPGIDRTLGITCFWKFSIVWSILSGGVCSCVARMNIASSSLLCRKHRANLTIRWALGSLGCQRNADRHLPLDHGRPCVGKGGRRDDERPARVEGNHPTPVWMRVAEQSRGS